MRPQSLLTTSAFLGIFAAILLALPSVAAQSGDLTKEDEWIDLEYQISYSGVTEINMDILIRVREVENPDTNSRTTAKQIRDDYALLKNAGRESEAAAFMEPYERRLSTTILNSLKNFDSSGTPSVDPVKIDETSLEIGPGEAVNAYHPAIRFATKATISLDRETLGIGDYEVDDIQAVLDAGALIRSDITIAADPGHTAWYNITPIAGAVHAVGPNHLPADAPPAAGEPMTFFIQNLGGTAAKEVVTWRELHSPTAERPTKEEINVAATMDLTKMLTGNGDGLPVDVTITADVMSVDVAKLGASLPETVNLNYMSAAGIRILNARGIITDEQLANGEDDILSEMAGAIGDKLGDSPFVGGFTTDSLAGTATGPVAFQATKSGLYPVDAENAVMEAAFRSGALIGFNYDLTLAADREQTYAFLLPANLFFKNAGGGVLAEDGTSLTFAYDLRGKPSETAQLELSLMHQDFSPADIKDGVATEVPSADPFTEQVATANLKIDLQDVDITLPGVIGGDLGSMQVVVTLSTAINVIEVPADALARLPDTVTLSHLPSDGFRLLYAAGAITPEDMAKADAELLQKVKDNLESVLGGTVTVTGGFDAASLTGAPDSGPLSSDRPLRFVASTSFSKPLSGGASGGAEAAMVLKTVSQTFSLPNLDGVDTVYRFVLPSGFSLEDAKGTNAAVETFQEDGRDGFTAAPSGEGSSVTMSIGVTSNFVLAKFWPWVLLAVIGVLVIVGLPVWGVARMMKKKKAD